MKEDILRLIGLGEAKTLSDAARQLGVNPTQPHSWAEADPEFAQLYRQARQVIADQIEKELIESENIIAKIFLLKGYRPEFRDNYKTIEIHDTRTRQLLEDLRRLMALPDAAETTAKEKPLELQAPAEENPFSAVISKVNENVPQNSP